MIKRRGSLLTSAVMALVLLVVSVFAGVLPYIQKGNSSTKAQQAKKVIPASKKAPTKVAASKQKSTKNSELPHGEEGGSALDGLEPKEIAAGLPDTSVAEISRLVDTLPQTLKWLPGKRSGLSMGWGRAINGAGDVFAASYSEYSFQPDGTYEFWGYEWGKKFRLVGLYSVDGRKLHLVEVRSLEGSSQLRNRELKFTANGSSFREEPYWEFVYDRCWNKDPKRPLYVDHTGRPFGEAPPSVKLHPNEKLYQMLPYDGGDFMVKAEIVPNDSGGDVEFIDITIIPYLPIAAGKPFDKVEVAKAKERIVKDAKLWLRQQGFPANVPIKVDAPF